MATKVTTASPKLFIGMDIHKTHGSFTAIPICLTAIPNILFESVNIASRFTIGSKARTYPCEHVVIDFFHRQLRRVTKTKGSFASDTALMELLFMVQRDVTAK